MTIVHEYSRVHTGSDDVPVYSYQCIVWRDLKREEVVDIAESDCLFTLKDWRHEKYPDSTYTQPRREGAIVQCWVGDNVYSDVVVLRLVKDVREETGTPPGERPEWAGEGYVGYCESEGRCELVWSWDDLNESAN